MAWGKLLGVILGLWLFKGAPVIGAIFGLVLGHQWDRRRHVDDNLPPDESNTASVQELFFRTCFTVLGHLAKIDGQVSEAEIALAESLMERMGLNAERRQLAQQYFREGRDASQSEIDLLVAQFRRGCPPRRRDLVQLFMELQIQMICADAVLSPQEDARLRAIASQLGFPLTQYLWLLGRVMAEMRFRNEQQASPVPPAQKLAAAYQVLGLKAGATDAEVKRAYRKLMSQHHPDKLVAKGLPEDMVRIATEKAKEISAAYDLIRASRK